MFTSREKRKINTVRAKKSLWERIMRMSTNESVPLKNLTFSKRLFVIHFNLLPPSPSSSDLDLFLSLWCLFSLTNCYFIISHYSNAFLYEGGQKPFFVATTILPQVAKRGNSGKMCNLKLLLQHCCLGE